MGFFQHLPTISRRGTLAVSHILQLRCENQLGVQPGSRMDQEKHLRTHRPNLSTQMMNPWPLQEPESEGPTVYHINYMDIYIYIQYRTVPPFLHFRILKFPLLWQERGHLGLARWHAGSLDFAGHGAGMLSLWGVTCDVRLPG